MKKIVFALLVVILIIPISYAGLIDPAKETLFGKDFPSCDGWDKGRIRNSDISGCEKYYELFETYSPENTPFDSLFLMALALMESSCMENTRTGKGLLQALECKDGACDGQPDKQIFFGVEKHLVPAFDRFKAMELSGEEIVSLTLFEYNTGVGTGIEVKRLLSENMPPEEAMDKACLKYYSAEMCNSPGYGKGYPKRFFEEKYNKVCGQLGGKPSSVPVKTRKEIPPMEEPLSKITSGKYSIRPSFIVYANKDPMRAINELKEKAEGMKSESKPLLEEFEKCISDVGTELEMLDGQIDEKCREIAESEGCKKANEEKSAYEGYAKCKGQKSTFETSVKESASKYFNTAPYAVRDCEFQEEKILHQVVEEYMLCKSSPENLCYCKTSIDIPDDAGSNIILTIESSKQETESSEKSEEILFSVGGFAESLDGGFQIFNPDKNVFEDTQTVTYTFTPTNSFSTQIVFGDNMWADQRNEFVIAKMGNNIGLAPIKPGHDLTASMPACTLKKEIFTFCVEDSSDLYYYSGSERKPLLYRFAIDFSSGKKEGVSPPSVSENPAEGLSP